MRLSMHILLYLSAFVVLARAQSVCYPYTVENWDYRLTAAYWYFGSNDGGGSTIYEWALYSHYYTNADLYLYVGEKENSLLYYSYPMINQAPIEGGKNMSVIGGNIQYDYYTPTANFTCLSNTSAVWGPSYPDYHAGDGSIRSRHPNLEVYTHYSVPMETSYIRTIYHVKNIGDTPDRVRLWTLTWTYEWATDISPFNDRRYYTGYSYEAGDQGVKNNDPASSYAYRPTTMHARGQKALDKTSIVYGDMDNYMVGTSYTTVLGPGQEFALMLILSVGSNISTALKNAAEIDAEPAYIFHDLTADQLSMIRNWGGCQVIIGPTATVTVTPPAQCSSGLTSDFTVQASSTRTDLKSTDFTHRVVGIQNIELVTYQSSTTLSVPNGAGSVRHQLWYKECLVKETEFTACTRS